MTAIRKPDGTETSSLHERVNVILDYLFTEDSEEENSHHKNIRKAIEEPIHTNEDADFTQEEIKNTIETFNHNKSPGLDGITGGIYQRTFHMFPRIITTICNQCLKRGCFPKR
jgi:3-keto-L-gulonate-6-phosphate decarboxylase